jgi:hypothetical protein
MFHNSAWGEVAAMPFCDTSEAPALAKQFYDFLRNCDDRDSLRMRKWQNKALEQMCRHLEWFCEPSVSKAAADEARKRGWNLAKYEYKDRKKIEAIGDKLFHFEHVEPVGQLVKKMMAARESLSRIESVILSADVAWILDRENKKLDAMGYNSIRLPSGRDCYRLAGIELYPTVM